MKTFLQGIVVGMGAVAPGLSGSILLVIFGLYRKIVYTVAHIFKDFKKNLLFLFPLAISIGIGIIIFSKLISIPLEHFPMQTYYLFLGLILGTIPMLFREIRKEGFSPKYYVFIACAFIIGAVFFLCNMGLFPDIENPSLLQSVGLGLAVAAAYLVPGVDSFAILSTFGLYNLWLDSINTFDFSVLIPAAVGVCIGGIAISLLFNLLFSKWYTGTYSIIFGLFLAVILNFVVKECPPPSLDLRSAISVVLLIVGFVLSLVFSRLEDIVTAIKAKKESNT